MVNLQKLLNKTESKVGKTLFIAVDGHGGSGKTTLAKWLSEKLGAEIIHTDDFAGWDNPLNWYPNVIEQVFEPISKDAKTLSYQPASWWENHHPDPVKDQSVTDVMILEGVSSSRSEFRDYISLSIFVDTPKDICLERGVNRDTGTGKSIEELTKMWEEWFAEEDVYIKRDNPKENADIVINGTKPFEEQITI